MLASEKIEVPLRFDRASHRYDLLTGANPGYHRHLRMSAERLGLGRGARILDLCCGTGSSTAALRAAYPEAEIVGLDFSAGMLEQARRKPELRATFVHGDATDPRAAGVEGTFDAIFCAYGIRNLPDPDRALGLWPELLRPGGRVAFHEYALDGSVRARVLWDAVCWGVIVPAGAVSGSGTTLYRYLWRSVRDFDSVSAFPERLARHGWRDVRTQPMDGWQVGILHTFVATRPDAHG